MVKFLNPKRIIVEGILFLLILLMGWEWLAALPSFTDTGRESLWMFYIAFTAFFSLYILIPWKWVSFVASLGFFLYWYHFTLWDGPLFAKEWIISSYELMKEYGHEIIRMNWAAIDPAIRTGLFYLFVWIVVYLLYHRVIVKRKVIGLLILTITYLSVLDTFFLFDGRAPLIKSLAYGFILLAVVNLQRLEKMTRRSLFQLKLLPWFLCTLAIVLILTTVGIYAPKAEPQWPDPVSFLQAMKGGSGKGAGGIAVSGYGNDDSRLGGSFRQTMDTVFVAEVRGEKYPAHYWRGESKEIYTGKGWESYAVTGQPLLLNSIIPFSLIHTKNSILVTENVTFNNEENLIFAGGQPNQVLSLTFPDKPAEEPLLYYSQFNHRIDSRFPLKGYVIEAEIPVISEDELIAISEQYHHSTTGYPEEIMRIYTQLPETLPERVKQLGAEIVGDETNIYKKVKAIEHYLRWGSYSYQINNIPYPDEGQDFVDQFLFETREGYCDHFSTSMVVLLRTQGIPARWVKGFAYGEVTSDGENHHTITVRGKDAHSWVEVFFPGVGWVPFEPTASFSFPYQVERATADAQPVTNLDDQEQMVDNEPPEIDQSLKEKELDAKGSGVSGKQGSTKWILYLFLILLISLLVFYYRKQIWYRIEALSVVKDSGIKLIYRTYRLTLKWLGQIYAPRAEHQTIREYSASLDLNEEKKDLIRLTKTFEEVRYGERVPDLSKREFLHIWRNLIKKLRS